MSNICFNLNNNVINLNNNSYNFDISLGSYTYFGLSQTDINNYTIYNIPKQYPLTFFSQQTNNISNIITFNNINTTHNIIIYVSIGNDELYNNQDYFRFYDASYNLININNSFINTYNNIDINRNLFFVRGLSYEFIATTDYSPIHTFSISGNTLTHNYILNNNNSSFILYIDNTINNTTGKIFYLDYNNTNIIGNLNVLVDSYNNPYFYNNIQFSINPHYYDVSTILLSIQSFPFYNGISKIQNLNLFTYSNTCSYITNDYNLSLQILENQYTAECLNIVSKANICSSGNIHYYEFNYNKHATLTNINNLYNLNYGIYDGTYVIFNINPNYPISLINTTSFYIDTTYSNTNIINKTHSIIQNLQSPYNTYNFYYGAIKLIINNFNNNINLNKIFNIFILDYTNKIAYTSNNYLFYTNYCILPETTNQININTDVSFILYNQFGNPFTTDYKNNLYILNKYHNYIEYNPAYKVIDKFGYDISNLVIVSIPQDLSDILYLTNNYTINNFFITYNLTDYQNNSIQLLREVFINSGPIIDINDISYAFQNNNTNQSMIVTINNNTNYLTNFYNSIKSYIYDINKNIINLPFEIELSGSYYNSNNTQIQLNKYILEYNNINDSPLYIYSKNLFYYFSQNIIYQYDLNNANINNNYNNGVYINNIATINFNNYSSSILSNSVVLTINKKNQNFSYNQFITHPDNANNLINNLQLNGIDLYVISINNNNNTINIAQSSTQNILNTFITLDNSTFKINMIDLKNPHNNLIISGTFNPILIFSSSNINLNYIGNYDLTIHTKGLQKNDIIFNDLSNMFSVFNYSRTFNIQVISYPPTITFLNNNNNSYSYNYPITLSFNILNNILLVSQITNSNINYTNYNIPVIGYTFDSIYNLTTDNLITNVSNLQNCYLLNNAIYPINTTTILNTSANIKYTLTDINNNLFSNNTSQSITLNLNFLTIPIISLLGNPDIYVNLYETSYNDLGLLINNDYNNILYISFTNNNIANSTHIYSNFTISVTTNLNFNIIGNYYLTFTISKTLTQNLNNYVTRNIYIVKNYPPYISIKNLSSLNYITHYNDIFYQNITPTTCNINNINNFTLDFSLSVLNSNFYDLSYILHDFILQDNYNFLLNTNGLYDLSYSITYVKNNNNYNFNNTDFYKTLIDLSYINPISQIFNYVTSGINKLYPLTFIYNITDPCNNIFNFKRNVNIIDYTLPTINFKINPYIQQYINSNIISYTNTNNYYDFSFQAIDINVNSSDFISQLNHILFDFSLNDNYNSSFDISNNYYINILKNDVSYINIHSISDITINPYLNSYFKKINNSLILKYNFYDNQYNYSYINRNVTIINTIIPEISFNFSKYINNIPEIDISFGDISFNFNNNYFNLYHSRINSNIFNFQLNYDLTPYKITSISGSNNKLYDPSALIYSIPNTSLNNYKFITYNINFTNVITNYYPNLTSNILNIPVKIINYGPNIYINVNEISNNIISEAGYFIPDASLIFGVYSTSIFDTFWFYNNNYTYIGTNVELINVYNNNNNNTYLNQISPVVGKYIITYTSTDKNNAYNTYYSKLNIIDTQPPTITLFGLPDISVNTNSIYKEQGVTFIDKGSDISYIKLILTDNSNINVIDSSLSIYNINNKSYNYNTNLLTFLNNTNKFNGIYTLKYIASDIYDNSASVERHIQFLQLPFLTIKPYIEIKKNNLDVSYVLNHNFNLQGIKYNNTIKTITYEATYLKDFNNDISFGLTAKYGSYDISQNYLTIVQNINPNIVDNYQIVFQAFETFNYTYLSQIIYFNVVDTTPPSLSFINSNDYNNINNLILPLLSKDTYPIALNMIDYNKTNPYLFIPDSNGYYIYSIPGINIIDIVNNININTLSNETLPIKYQNNITLNINYTLQNVLNNIITISNNYLLTNAGTYTQKYGVYDNAGNYSYISRIINIQRLPPIINLNYEKDPNNNIYKKYYHQHYYPYYELGSYIFDYYQLDLSYQTNVFSVIQNFDENILGQQQILYKLVNNNTINNTTFQSRNIEVVDIECLDVNVNNITQSLHNCYLNNNLKLGINYGIYNLNIDNSNNAIRLFGYNSDDNILLDISNLINISGQQYITQLSPTNNLNLLEISYNLNSYNYYYGNFTINVNNINNNNFNRVSIEQLIDICNSNIFIDTILFNNNCIPYNFPDLFNSNSNSNFNIFNSDTDFNYISNTNYNFNSNSNSNFNSNSNSNSNSNFNSNSNSNSNFNSNSNSNSNSNFNFNSNSNSNSNSNLNFNSNYYQETIDVDVSNINHSVNLSTPYFILDGEYKPILYLSVGYYKFDQNYNLTNYLKSGFRNFYNSIKFSLIPDGIHNTDPSINQPLTQFNYTKNMREVGIIGLYNSYTEILLDATTPCPLYYYSQHFPNMGGVIYIKNNYIFYKNVISINGYVLSADNSGSLYNSNINLNDKIFLSQTYNLNNNNNGNNYNQNFIGITQQNLTHNIIISNNPLLNSKIIFKKYQNISELTTQDTQNYYNIVEDNSLNYLLDISMNNYNSNIVYINYDIDTSINLLMNTYNNATNNIIKINNNNNLNITNNKINQFEFDFTNFFYKNNELYNFYDFFIKNHIITDSLLLNPIKNNIYIDNFIYKINEIAYTNKVQLLNGGSECKFFSDSFLPCERTFINTILNNTILFNLQIFLDISSLKISPDYLNYLKNNIFNQNLYNYSPHYPLDNTKLFFEELVVYIYSDICINNYITTKTYNTSINFSQGNLELSDYLLDISSSSILLALYNDLNENDKREILKNNIILTIRDNSYVDNTFIGLTEQNFFNNIYLEDNYKFVFHNYYDYSCINYEVNTDNLTIEETNKDLINNNLFLLEISSNDIYNCFTDSSYSIYDTGIYKNNVLYKLNSNNYQVLIDYLLYDELPLDNSYLSILDIRPKSLNDISYGLYPYAYSKELQNLHSASYIIDLNKSMDRILYDNSYILIPYLNINYQHIYYNLIDISYNYNRGTFNLYDLDILYNIIYNKDDVYKLNYIQNYIHFTNYKLDYLQLILTTYINGVTFKNFTYIDNLNLQTPSKFFYNSGFIEDNYHSLLDNASLNELYQNNYTNSKILIKKYNNVIDVLNYYEYIIDFSYNNYLNIIYYYAIDQLLTDVSLINLNIDELVQNLYYRSNEERIINYLQETNSNFIINQYTDFNMLLSLLINFYNIIDNFGKIILEMELRHGNNNGLTQNYVLKEYINILNIYDLNDFTIALFNNYLILNTNLINFIEYNYLNINVINNELNEPILTDISLVYDTSIIENLINLTNTININYNYAYSAIDNKYNISNKKIIYLKKINYNLGGSRLLINSFQSTNILLKFNIYYNSYLYENIYLDTIIVDIAIPDLTPPSIIFNSLDISLNQNYCNPNDINKIIDIILNNINYIDINQSSPLIKDNTINYSYNNIFEYNLLETFIINDINSLITIDISAVSQVIYGSYAYRDIYFTIKDNANNVNTIIENVYVYNSALPPYFVYNNKIINNNINFDGNNLIVLKNDANNIILEKAKLDISGIDPSYPNNILTFSNNYLSLDISTINNNNFIIYKATNILENLFTTAYRYITISNETLNNICCYPKVYYKPIQFNYRLGSFGATNMRLGNILLNNK